MVHSYALHEKHDITIFCSLIFDENPFSEICKCPSPISQLSNWSQKEQEWVCAFLFYARFKYCYNCTYFCLVKILVPIKTVHLDFSMELSAVYCFHSFGLLVQQTCRAFTVRGRPDIVEAFLVGFSRSPNAYRNIHTDSTCINISADLFQSS